MAKRKGSSKRPQAEHKCNRKKSQHDKRERLNRPNPQRKKTTKARIPLAGAMQTAVLVRHESPRTRSPDKGLVGSRWRLCGATILEAAARNEHRRCEPLAKGRLPV